MPVPTSLREVDFAQALVSTSAGAWLGGKVSREGCTLRETFFPDLATGLRSMEEI